MRSAMPLRPRAKGHRAYPEDTQVVQAAMDRAAVALHPVALHTWFIYFLAAVGLSLSPGPNGLLALTHGALHGRRKALYTIFGGALGFVTLIALSMFGIGALLQASIVWLTVLKWVGGAYLVWLGIQVWRSPPMEVHVTQGGDGRPGWSLFKDGLLSALSNPKALLFFAAFLPQFIDPHRNLVV